ncbi:MAG: PqqD family protein [Candidatus Omnitrophota bacterium]
MDILNKIYEKSKRLIVKKIGGETFIVPFSAKVIDAERAILFSLHETAIEIWDGVDGRATVGKIIEKLSRGYEVDRSIVLQDTVDLLRELERRGLIIEVT